jgi:F-type H+-transporting ATPase subunit delta
VRISAAARRYGKALFSLARDESRVDAVRGELASFASLISESAPLRDALLTPLHPVAERRRVLEALARRLGTSPIVRHLFAYLIDQRRLVDFLAIRAEYERLCDQASGRTVAQVTVAADLDASQGERLRAALSRRTGREVTLEVRSDPALLGGAIAKVGDLVFDGSLRTQLAQLRGNLTKGS